MTDINGLAGIDSLSAQINALKNKPGNSAAAGTNSTTDPSTFILQTEQNFNSMLDALTSTPDSGSSNSSSDPFSFLTNNNQNSLLAQQNTNSTSAQNLTTLGQNSPLLGQQIIYQDSTGAQNAGVVSKIMLDRSNQAVIILTDGRQVSGSAVIGIQK